MLSAATRVSWDLVCARCSEKGAVMTWQDAKHEFKRMVGEVIESAEDEANRGFLDGRVKMTAGQTVNEYRTVFAGCAVLCAWFDA